MELPEGEIIISTYEEAKAHAKLLFGFSDVAKTILKNKEHLINKGYSDVMLQIVTKNNRKEFISQTEWSRKQFLESGVGDGMREVLLKYVGYINNVLNFSDIKIWTKQLEITKKANADAASIKDKVKMYAIEAFNPQMNEKRISPITISNIRLFAKFLGDTVIVK